MKEVTVLACIHPACEEKVAKTLHAMGTVIDHKFKELEKRIKELEDQCPTS